MIAFSKQELYGVQVQTAKHNLGILSDPRSEQCHSNTNEQSRVERGTNQKGIYIRRVKPFEDYFWKNKSTWQNSQELKCFLHVSTLFKNLRLVVSIQTDHMFTSLDSIERLFFSYKVFSSLSPWWFFIRGGECRRPIILRTVQGYFSHTRQRSDAIRVIRPDCWVRSELLSPTPHQDMRWQSHHIITEMQDCIPT